MVCQPNLPYRRSSPHRSILKLPQEASKQNHHVALELEEEQAEMTTTIPAASSCCQPQKQQKRQRLTVHWGDVVISKFPMILGDHPGVDCGALPVTLDWKQQGSSVIQPVARHADHAAYRRESQRLQYNQQVQQWNDSNNGNNNSTTPPMELYPAGQPFVRRLDAQDRSVYLLRLGYSRAELLATMKEIHFIQKSRLWNACHNPMTQEADEEERDDEEASQPAQVQSQHDEATTATCSSSSSQNGPALVQRLLDSLLFVTDDNNNSSKTITVTPSSPNNSHDRTPVLPVRKSSWSNTTTRTAFASNQLPQPRIVTPQLA